MFMKVMFSKILHVKNWNKYWTDSSIKFLSKFIV